jgi:tight adherence protein B
MSMLSIILFLCFVTVGIVTYLVVPIVYSRFSVINEKRQQKFTADMEQILSRKDAKKKVQLLILAPLAFAGVAFLFSPDEMKLVGAIVGLVVGFVFPGIYIKALARRTQDKFADQMIDALMIMSSSFRGGLSLIQAMEAVVEEMPDPISREFGIVLGENKMGVSLEEALNHLYNRMPLVSLQQMNTAILLARETGGNLPVIFTRIVNTIRENKKIKQNLDTLTLQGKIQGVVMSGLPIAFGYVVYASNRAIFEHMFTSDLGRLLLIYSVVSEVIGAFMIWKISTFKDF